LNEIESLLKTKYRIELEELKSKYPPISELIDNQVKILKIKNIYKINEKYKHLFLIKARNYLKLPKLRYFLTINLAFQSSDLLVNLVSNMIKNDSSLKLIQFSLYPKSNRVNLLALKELESVETFSNTVMNLKQLRKDFRRRLQHLTKSFKTL
jgi:hypothetical protein